MTAHPTTAVLIAMSEQHMRLTTGVKFDRDINSQCRLIDGNLYAEKFNVRLAELVPPYRPGDTMPDHGKVLSVEPVEQDGKWFWKIEVESTAKDS